MYESVGGITLYKGYWQTDKHSDRQRRRYEEKRALYTPAAIERKVAGPGSPHTPENPRIVLIRRTTDCIIRRALKRMLHSYICFNTSLCSFHHIFYIFSESRTVHPNHKAGLRIYLGLSFRAWLPTPRAGSDSECISEFIVAIYHDRYHGCPCKRS